MIQPIWYCAVKSRRYNALTGLVTRICEIHGMLYRMLVTKFDVRKILGRLCSRWRGIINLNFSKIVCVDVHDVR
jgi:hypothetical protein